MPVKQPNPIDVHVGRKVRLRRMQVGMSQEKLGESIGITFQQIQKYEKGANRIGATRLYQIGVALDVPIGHFFEGVAFEGLNYGPSAEPVTERPLPAPADEISSVEGLALNSAFFGITNPVLRRKLIELVKTMAEMSDESAL